MEQQSLQPYNPENNRRYDGVDRRKASVELVDGKLAELEHRRNLRLEEKLKAMEVLFDKTVNTKSDAHSIAISRIQGDTGACKARCERQIGIFYDILNGIKIRNEHLDTEFSFIKTSFTKHETDVDECFHSNEEECKKIKDRLVVLEEWKKYFWMINLPIIVGSTATFIVAVYKLAEWGYKWYHSIVHIKDIYP